MITFLLVCFAFLLIIGAPIAVGLGLSSALGMIFVSHASLVTVGQRTFEGMNSFALLAVPLYTFAGLIMGKGGIAKRIIDFAYSLVGHIYGGLAHVNVMASMIFAGISGSSAADTAGVSGMMMPQMMRKGYSKEFTVAVTAISSTIGIIIPPSIPMVVIAGILGVSTGKMFLGGILPGIILGIAQMIVSYFMAKKEKVPREEGHFELKPIWIAFKDGFWALLMPGILMGGIMSGFVSPTEAGALAVLYALIVSGFVYRELHWKDLKQAMIDTGKTCGKIFILIGCGSLFTKILTGAGFHLIIQHWLLSITHSPTIMLILILLIVLFVTCFMDTIATLTMLMPILFPVTQAVGLDPILFCVMVVVCCGVGLVTPPVGVCLYIACDLVKLPIVKAIGALMPFILITLVCIALFIACPQLILLPASIIKG
jgi:tripartite ATP-independent transporter DctM subunit